MEFVCEADDADDVTDALIWDECAGDRVPNAGEQVHHQEHRDGGQTVANNLGHYRIHALERHIALEREVDALTKDNGGHVAG